MNAFPPKAEKERKAIGVDLDEILLDFNEYFCRYNAARHGTTMRREDIHTFDMGKAWGWSDEMCRARVFEFFDSTDHQESLPVAGSVEGISELRRDYDLHIVTSRPDHIAERTRAWIERHFPGAFKSVQFTNQFNGDDAKKRSKASVCQDLGIDIFVEDAPENALGVSSSGVPVLLFDTPWNQGLQGTDITRIFSWNEIVQHIQRAF